MTCILNLNGSQNCRVLQVFAFLSGDRIRYLSEVLLRSVSLVDKVSLVHSSVSVAIVSLLVLYFLVLVYVVRVFFQIGTFEKFSSSSWANSRLGCMFPLVRPCSLRVRRHERARTFKSSQPEDAGC